jgi:hypothetical protein
MAQDFANKKTLYLSNSCEQSALAQKKDSHLTTIFSELQAAQNLQVARLRHAQKPKTVAKLEFKTIPLFLVAAVGCHV